MKPLVVTATRREAAIIRLGGVVAAGSGRAAGDAVRRHLEHDAPDLLIIAGVCGGLDPSLKHGTLILARSIAMAGAERLEPDQTLFELLRTELRKRHVRFVSSNILTVDRPVVRRDEKTRVWNTHGAGGVDMESYFMALAAREAGVPWVALRCVLDGACRTLPVSLREWSQEADEGRILRRAAGRPGEWSGYVRLALDWRTASRELAAGVRLAHRVLEVANAPAGGSEKAVAHPA